MWWPVLVFWCVDRTLQYPHFFSPENEMLLNFSVDGVPLFISANVQMWPILCSVKKVESYIVALFVELQSQTALLITCPSFLTQLKALQQHGIVFQNGTLKVKVNAFICDAPARAFLNAPSPTMPKTVMSGAPLMDNMLVTELYSTTSHRRRLMQEQKVMSINRHIPSTKLLVHP